MLARCTCQRNSFMHPYVLVILAQTPLLGSNRRESRSSLRVIPWSLSRGTLAESCWKGTWTIVCSVTGHEGQSFTEQTIGGTFVLHAHTTSGSHMGVAAWARSQHDRTHLHPIPSFLIRPVPFHSTTSDFRTCVISFCLSCCIDCAAPWQQQI